MTKQDSPSEQGKLPGMDSFGQDDLRGGPGTDKASNSIQNDKLLSYFDATLLVAILGTGLPLRPLSRLFGLIALQMPMTMSVRPYQSQCPPCLPPAFLDESEGKSLPLGF